MMAKYHVNRPSLKSVTMDTMDEADLQMLIADIYRYESWMVSAQRVIEKGVELMDNDQLRQWSGVRTAQETCPVQKEVNHD